MLKFISYFSFFLSIFLLGCSNSEEDNTIERDFNEIKTEGKLRVMIHYSSTSYFIYKGIPQGFEYELLNNYANQIGVALEVIPIKNMDSIFFDLNEGRADIIAANLTVTPERKEIINYTLPVIFTKQVLVQRKPQDWKKMKKTEISKQLVNSVEQLASKKVVVRENSSFYGELKKLNKKNKIDIGIELVSGEYTSEELIEMVAEGQIEYTVADKNIAEVNSWYYPILDVKTELSNYQDIAWAVRQNSDTLVSSINSWLHEFKKTRKFKAIYNKYFRNQQLVKKRYNHDYFTLESGAISPYDKIFKKHEVDFGWDWELLTSLVYQESHFNNAARGYGNSFGLMQFMPETGAKFGVDTNSGPEQNIIAGIKYINRLNEIWEKEVEDKQERIYFILASYNAGPGHVIDAKNLADKYGKNPQKWSDVSFYLRNKSKPKYYNDEVVKSGYCKGFIACDYADEIMERFHHYQNITQTIGEK
ncbi:MAG: transporter substrate-binding domain-containing protein [Flavobacteriales bacterium]|nr:transporter substrate-binding domain-containing protein [Flavobacteriales bacterium]